MASDMNSAAATADMSANGRSKTARPSAERHGRLAIELPVTQASSPQVTLPKCAQPGRRSAREHRATKVDLDKALGAHASSHREAGKVAALINQQEFYRRGKGDRGRRALRLRLERRRNRDRQAQESGDPLGSLSAISLTPPPAPSVLPSRRRFAGAGPRAPTPARHGTPRRRTARRCRRRSAC